MDEIEKQIAELREKIASLERLRDDLGAELVGAKIVAFQAEIERLVQTGGAYVEGQVDTRGGDFIGRDQNVWNIYLGVYEGLAPKTQAEALTIYRQVVASRCGELPLHGMDLHASDATSAQLPLSLSNVYINLDTQTQAVSSKVALALSGEPVDWRPEDRARWRPPELSFANQEPERDMRPLTALEAAILSRHLVLLGDPGSGKTTFANNLAHSLALRAFDHLPGWPENERKSLPILLILREFARWVIHQAQGTQDKFPKPSPRLVWDFIAHDLAERKISFAAPHLEAALENGQAVVLLDGLDEIPPGPIRTQTRESVLAFARRYEQNRYLVTCRTLSYQQPEWKLPERNFPDFKLAPFNEDKIGAFIRAWYAEVSAKWKVPFSRTVVLAGKLAQAVRRPDLAQLAPNPLLLTVMALVHTHEGELPEARALLYEKAVDILLWRWEQEKSKEYGEMPELLHLLRQAGRGRGDLRVALASLAYQAHAEGGQAEDSDAVAGISLMNLLNTLRRLHPDNSLDWAMQLVDMMKMRAGLLLERSGDLFAFPHRTFQEYLAGVHLAMQANFAESASRLAEQEAFWREVILLAVGHLVHSNQDYGSPRLLVEELCPSASVDTPAAWVMVVLAGEVLLELGVNRALDTAHGRALLERVRLRLVELLERGALSASQRARAGDVLAQLGDPRFDPETLQLPHLYRGQPEPFLGFVKVEAGLFSMGSRQGDKDAYKDEFGHTGLIDLPYDYWIARYPVTVAQMQAFVEAGGYEQQEYWTETGWAWRRGAWDSQVKEKWLQDQLGQRPAQERGQPFWWRSQLGQPNRPVIGVSWFEALAYCRWLDACLRKRSLYPISWLQQGYCLRLPSEAEWEKAARAGNERRFPWGDADWDPEKANLENRIGKATAVGIYPQGATPTGIHELSGNVWEWALSLGKPYPYDPQDGRNDINLEGDRVLRGGTWDGDRKNARCAVRNWSIPGNFADDLGFRVVVSLADAGF